MVLYTADHALLNSEKQSAHILIKVAMHAALMEIGSRAAQGLIPCCKSLHYFHKIQLTNAFNEAANSFP